MKKEIKITKSNLEMFADNLLPKKQQTKVKGGFIGQDDMVLG